jgi:hypothetical protein
LLVRAPSQLVVAEQGVEGALPVQLRQLDGRDRAAPGSFLPRLERGDDLAGRRDLLDPRELDPLHVAHHRQIHQVKSHIPRSPAV